MDLLTQRKINSEEKGLLALNTETHRSINPALEDILGDTFQCLDKGFIRLVDYMGTETSIVQAARVSYGTGTKTIREDAALLRYLLEHEHTTPIEMVELKFHVRCPMDVWRQWIRQRTASVNEYSTRYSEAIDDKMQTHPEAWRLQSGTNKQGSDGYLTEFPEDIGNAEFQAYDRNTHESLGLMKVRDCYSNGPGGYLSDIEADLHQHATHVYNERLKFGIAKEQARKDLPLSTYTEAYWKIDMHNLLRFLSQRMDSHAQLEIREYANVLGAVVERGFPNLWRAHLDFDIRKNAMKLSAIEIAAVQIIVTKMRTDNASKLTAVQIAESEQSGIPAMVGKRGLGSLLEKLKLLGIE